MAFQKFYYLLISAAVTLMAATSCGDDDDKGYILAPGSSGGSNNPSAGSSTGDCRLRLEVPALEEGNLFVQHSVEWQGNDVMNYCLEYNPTKHHSRWIAFRFDATTRQQNVGRSSEPFMDDPSISQQYHIGYNGFGKDYIDINGQSQRLPSGQFDRGHLCASADRYLCREANEQTFYMSNMSPQMSNFNSPYWSSFEQKVQKWGRDASFADTLYVVKGGTIAQGQTLGYVQRPNGTEVTVPKYYFMALLKCKNNTYSAIAFWMEHKDYGDRELSNAEMSQKTVSIDKLEELTGIDFFHNLPDQVESLVESDSMPGAWGL